MAAKERRIILRARHWADELLQRMEDLRSTDARAREMALATLPGPGQVYRIIGELSSMLTNGPEAQSQTAVAQLTKLRCAAVGLIAECDDLNRPDPGVVLAKTVAKAAHEVLADRRQAGRASGSTAVRSSSEPKILMGSAEPLSVTETALCHVKAVLGKRRRKLGLLDLGKRIYCAVSRDRNVLGSTFVRFQEHYESPEFRGKVFTRREFRTWYRQSRGRKRYTYNEDWEGYNVPDHAFIPFLQGRFDPLVCEERRLLDSVQNLTPPFCILGIRSPHPILRTVLRHEIAHALWYLDPEYRAKALNVVATLPTEERNNMVERLLAIGYCEATAEDEIHAYLLDPLAMGWVLERGEALQMEMETIFSAHSPDMNDCMRRLEAEGGCELPVREAMTTGNMAIPTEVDWLFIAVEEQKEAAIPMVLSAMKEESTAMREAAVYLLGCWPQPDLLDQVLAAMNLEGIGKYHSRIETWVYCETLLKFGEAALQPMLGIWKDRKSASYQREIARLYLSHHLLRPGGNSAGRQ